MDHLVELRHQQGLSQTTVAARMRTSQSAVARLEAGDSDARLSTLARYASALGTELGFVVHSPAPPEGPDHTRRRAP
ncbi:MAG: helix-turn-helix domain-containing protein [Acidimicrobiales bacterium]